MTGFNGELRAHGDRQGGVSPTSLQKQVGEIRILDIRSEKQYAKEHIDTAVVLPLKEISESRLTQLGFQKSDEIVVYGNSEIPAKKAKLLLERRRIPYGFRENGCDTRIQERKHGFFDPHSTQ
jgi:rhodanese-related sulfurtransferase